MEEDEGMFMDEAEEDEGVDSDEEAEVAANPSSKLLN